MLYLYFGEEVIHEILKVDITHGYLLNGFTDEVRLKGYLAKFIPSEQIPAAYELLNSPASFAQNSEYEEITLATLFENPELWEEESGVK